MSTLLTQAAQPPKDILPTRAVGMERRRDWTA
jgi:hypothetical protein